MKTRHPSPPPIPAVLPLLGKGQFIPEAGSQADSAVDGGFDQRAYAPETIESLEAAKVLYATALEPGGGPFARSAAFAFCFAVENEVRLRLGEKVRKLLAKGGHKPSAKVLIEPTCKRLSPFFQRYLILARKSTGSNPLEYASLENYLHVLARIMELGPKYRPDGLKAFGVILFCFGTDFTLEDAPGAGKISAPLKSGGDDATVRELAGALMRLQHLRNPYVHPQSGEMKDLREIREEAERCLKGIQAIA